MAELCMTQAGFPYLDISLVKHTGQNVGIIDVKCLTFFLLMVYLEVDYLRDKSST